MAWFKRLTGIVVGMVAGSGPAFAQQELPEGWLDSQVNEHGQRCDRHEMHGDATGLLMACGAAGVWVVTHSAAGPRFVRSYAFAGEAIGFISEPNGALWVKLRVIEALPLNLVSAAAAVRFPEEAPASAPQRRAPGLREPLAATSTPSVPRPRTGRVLKSAAGEVLISLGTDDGLQRGDRVELSFGHVDIEPGEQTIEEAALTGDPLAVGAVTNVGRRTARVQLGLNESVPLGAVALPTRAASSAGLVAPPRVGGVWEAQLMARPFAAVGELGGGLLLRGSFARRFVSNFQVRALVDPLGFADVQSGEAMTAWNFAVVASYDSQFFEMGAGFGAQSVNDPGFFLRPGSGLSAAQLIRLGAQDGLSLSARTSVVLFHSELEFGDMTAALQIPINRGFWLLVGGGGSVGYGYGELGLRVLLSGNGLAGSKFLTLSAGGAGMFRSQVCDDVFSFECQQPLSFGGPMAGIGSEWRF
jgi:hypothetical protein